MMENRHGAFGIEQVKVVRRGQIDPSLGPSLRGRGSQLLFRIGVLAAGAANESAR
jgi:hypothetical protein